MKWSISGLTLVVVICVMYVHGGIEETMAGDTVKSNKDDNIQEEILQAMKDSGVLNEWKDKLDDMLFQENNEVKTDESKKSKMNPQERNMIVSYVQAYLSQKNYKITTDYIVGLIDRIQKTPTIDLPQVFVQLPSLIDVIGAIAAKTENVEKIIERQAPVFESPAKTVDILHTLSENLKSELTRLNTPAGGNKPPAKPKATAGQKENSKRNTKKAKKSGGGLDIADYLQLGSSLLQGGKASQLLGLLSGESDMSSMLSLLPQLLKSGNHKSILSKLISSYLKDSPYGIMIEGMVTNFLESEQADSLLESGMSWYETLMRSEAGTRITEALPKILAAKDTDTMLELAHNESNWYWDQFFASIENSDVKEKALDQLSENLVKLYEYFQNPPKGSTVAKAPMLLNGLLISNRLPAYDPRNPVKSITKMVNKAIKTFTTWKLDATPYITLISEVVYEAYQRQSKGIKLADLDFDQKKALLSRMLDTEVIEPSQAVWTVYSHSVGHPECIENLLCQINKRERDQHGQEARTVVTKFSSLAAAWVLANAKGVTDEGIGYFNLYKQSIWAGVGGADCMSEHPVRGGASQSTCNVFSWQNKNFMSTSYEHMEL